MSVKSTTKVKMADKDKQARRKMYYNVDEERLTQTEPDDEDESTLLTITQKSSRRGRSKKV